MSHYQTQFATWYLHISKSPDLCYQVWVDNPITRTYMPPQIFKWPNYSIFITWLSGWSNYPTSFATWNLQIAKITWFLSLSWVGNPITRTYFPPEISKFPTFPNFCDLVEWAIQLPAPICYLKSPNCNITWSLLPGLQNWVILAIWRIQVANEVG